MRSDRIKKGVNAAPQRSLLYALGLTEEETSRRLFAAFCGALIGWAADKAGRPVLDDLRRVDPDGGDDDSAGTPPLRSFERLTQPLGVTDGGLGAHLALQRS